MGSVTHEVGGSAAAINTVAGFMPMAATAVGGKEVLRQVKKMKK